MPTTKSLPPRPGRSPPRRRVRGGGRGGRASREEDAKALLGLCWDNIGVCLGIIRGYIGIILGLYWDYIGVISGLYGGYIGPFRVLGLGFRVDGRENGSYHSKFGLCRDRA